MSIIIISHQYLLSALHYLLCEHDFGIASKRIH